MSPILPCSCLSPIHWSQVLSQEWRCSWSSAERWCSNYIWMISQLIVYLGVSYIRGLMVDGVSIEMHLKILSVFCQLFCSGPSVSRGSVAGDVMAREVPKSPYFDSAWWRHQMETFSALLALCEGNPPVTGGFPSQRPVTELWCFSWSAPEQTVEQTVKMPVIWDAIMLIMTATNMTLLTLRPTQNSYNVADTIQFLLKILH